MWTRVYLSFSTVRLVWGVSGTLTFLKGSTSAGRSSKYRASCLQRHHSIFPLWLPQYFCRQREQCHAVEGLVVLLRRRKGLFFFPESMINLEKERNPERSRPVWSQLYAACKPRPTCRNRNFYQFFFQAAIWRHWADQEEEQRRVCVCAFGLPDEACYEFISTRMRKCKQEWNGYILAYDFKLTTMICKWLQSTGHHLSNRLMKLCARSLESGMPL